MNKNLNLALGAALLMLGLFTVGAARAHGDEDHSAPASAAVSTSLPRVGVTTEDFEIVAVLEAMRLLVFVDRSSSNEPVTQAQVEVDGVGPGASAPEVAPGVYALTLAQPLAAGAHALTVTIQTADTSDLLTATLEVPATVEPSVPAVRSGFVSSISALWPWLAGAAGLATAGLLVLAAGVGGLRRDVGHLPAVGDGGHCRPLPSRTGFGLRRSSWPVRLLEAKITANPPGWWWRPPSPRPPAVRPKTEPCRSPPGTVAWARRRRCRAMV